MLDSLEICDADDGKTLATIPSGAPRKLAFSPDGRLLATPASAAAVRLSNATDGREVRLLGLNAASDRGSVDAVTFRADGKYPAAAGGEGNRPGTITVWDLATGQLVFTLRGLSSPVTDVAFSPDGSRLAARLGGDTLKVWNTAPPSP
jgi:WD40 repeat protein